VLRNFADGASEPTEEGLQAQLAGAWPPMRSVIDMAGGFRREWNFSNSGGWTLKVHDGQQALWDLTPLWGSFSISMAIREAERDALLADGTIGDGAHEQLESARQFAEGYAVRFDVGDSDDLAAIEPFLRALMALRK
jgi:hypothetical protein